MAQLRPRHLGELSDIECEHFTCGLPSRDYGAVLVVRFSGECGYGSASNSDCAYMAAMVRAGLAAFRSLALVLDMRELKYEWGDLMPRVLLAGQDQYVDAPFPTAVISSDKNREGLASLIRDEMDEKPGHWLFKDLDAALAYLDKQIAA